MKSIVAQLFLWICASFLRNNNYAKTLSFPSAILLSEKTLKVDFEACEFKHLLLAASLTTLFFLNRYF